MLKFKDISPDCAACHRCAKEQRVGNGLPGTPILSRTRKGDKIGRSRKNHGSSSARWMAKKGRVGKVF